MDQTLALTAIAGMALVTYIPRVAPLLALSSRELHPGVRRWLGYVPTAVLSAMLAVGIVVEDGALDLGMDNVFLLATVPTLAAAILTRSFFGTVAVGMAVVAGGRYFLNL